VKILDVVPSSSEVSVMKMMLLATFTATIYATVAIANVVEAMHEVENVVKDALRMVIQGKLITLKLVNFNHFSGVSNAAVT